MSAPDSSGHAAEGDLVRTISVDPARLERWLATFARRHGACRSRQPDPGEFILRAADGAEARIAIPFPPVPGGTGIQELVEHVTRDRMVGAILVRRGGVAVGVFEGRRLVCSKVETSYVQGRTKAGGWSQQRFARRRDNQARKVTDAAAELVSALILPRSDRLAGLATGGDRGSVETVLADPRFSRLCDLRLRRVYPVPDPRLAVLRSFPDQFLAVEIALNDLA
jgi:Actinobacteria/chloroflexi VLRF1 release factor